MIATGRSPEALKESVKTSKHLDKILVIFLSIKIMFIVEICEKRNIKWKIKITPNVSYCVCVCGSYLEEYECV